jgi:hypothetical protein
MTGPEHYREAEAILERLGTFDGAMVRAIAAETAAIAQVHATLAAAAATALGQATLAEREAWHQAAGVPL